jgi:hypothetical protein
MKGRRGDRRRIWYVVLVLLALALVTVVYAFSQTHTTEPIILYVNQGNGAVNGSNFASMADYASSRGFNTVFFQIYRQGVTLFSSDQLTAFVNESHSRGLKIFFALYITNSSQDIPTSILNLGEDGMNLDMSSLDTASQERLLAGLEALYHGVTAVTTTDMQSPLKPDLLILETYGPTTQEYIRHGIIASVGVFTTSSEQDYKSQFQYALQNSDGVMVFDYAGLLKKGY